MKKIINIGLLICLMFLSGCKAESTNDRNTIDSYESAVEQTELIVTGHFENYEYSWNMARDVNDSSKESTEYYVEGKVFSFVAEKVLKGNLSDATLYVNQRYSDNYSGKTLADEYFIEVTDEQTYMLFLNYNSEFKMYYGSFDPFIFNVEEDEVYPSVSNDEIRDLLGTTDISTIVGLVQ